MRRISSSSSGVIWRTGLAGTPITSQPAGTTLPGGTTAPAPTWAFSSIDRAGQDDGADPDPRVVLDGARVDDRPVPDGHAVPDDAGELGRDVEHRAVLDVRVPAEADVVVLVAAEHGPGPDARALLDRDVADHLRGGIDPRVGMDARLPAGDLPDHRVTGLAAAPVAAICWRIARLSARARVGQLRDDREVVVTRHVHHLDVKAAPSPGGGEGIRLPVVLVALERADGEEERAGGRRDQVDRAVPPRRLHREPEGFVQVAEPDRLEVVEPADAAAGLDDVGGQPREGGPVRRHQHRDQMAAGRVARHGDVVGIAAESCRRSGGATPPTRAPAGPARPCRRWE